MDEIADAKITTVALSLRSQLTGRFPMSVSRSVPPPTAVTKASTNTPNGSNFFSIAEKAPTTAKEKVPNMSMIKRKLVGMEFNKKMKLSQKSLLVIASEGQPTQSAALSIDEFMQIAAPAKVGIAKSTFETASL